MAQDFQFLHVRIPAALKQRLDALSAEEQRTLQVTVTRLLEAALATSARPPKRQRG